MKPIFYLIALLCTGALFGFFFTMSFSIMPGLDLTAPYSAILANQEIGHATQKSYFAVALIGTPVSLAILFGLLWRSGLKVERLWVAAAFLSFIAMMVVTLTLNVPLNQIIDALPISADQENLNALWLAYSVDWQKWNLLRVLFSGVSLLALGFALLKHNTQNP